MPVMRCPYCKKVNTELFDTRKRERGYVRIRVCRECGRKFSTVETYSEQTLRKVFKESEVENERFVCVAGVGVQE